MKKYYILRQGEQTYVAQWSGGKVVVAKDSRSVDDVLRGAEEKGFSVRYEAISFGSKTTEGIVDAIGWDWEPCAWCRRTGANND